MKSFYPFFLLSILFFITGSLQKTGAQDCNSLSFTYTTKESRCMATGSVLVNASGGSGSYNYKVTGPVTTSFTSSNNITGLEPGAYTLIVRDINNNCEQTQNITITGSYSDPKFQLTKTDVSCAGNDGLIMTSNLQFGRAPFSYKIIAPSPSKVGTTSSIGHFTGLIAGEYAIQLQDSCGGIQVRRITIQNYSWWFDQVTGAKTNCDNATITATLKDNKGNLNTSGTSFDGFEYRIISPVTTGWQSNRTIAFTIGSSRSATIQAKDDCGNIFSATWSIPNNEKPSLGTVDISNRTCSGFTATVNGKQNLTSPVEYYLYEGNVLKGQNQNGTFTNVAYGNYCIRATDACYDTTIERCFSATRLLPSVASSVTIANRTCSTFTARITGQANLTNAQYCLFDAGNNPIQTCNATGEFNAVPYGSYYITIRDIGCVDTTFRRTFVENNPIPTLNPVSVSGSTCTGFNIQTTGGTNLFNTPTYCLYDNNGNRLMCNSTGIFTGISPHGTYCVRGVTSCNDTTAPRCVTTTPPVPSVAASVQISNKNCTTFSANITGRTNLTNPVYCLFDAADNPLLPCNNTGEFHNLPYGSYKITIDDGCIDTIITRTFSASQPVPTISNTFAVSNKGCSTFTATVSGANLINPVYYLFDNANNEIGHNSTGIFDNVPYGTYCAEIRDDCGNITERKCQTVSTDKSITVNASKTCNYGYTSMQISFASTNSPYTIKIYHPNGSLVYNTTTNNATTTVTTLPSLPDNLQYKVIGSDLCNNADSIMVLPVAAEIVKSVTVQSKCPSSTWQNGSGDLSVNCTSNYYTVTPKLFKKNGANYFAGHSSNTGTNFIFSDLEPATYIIEYTMQNCSGKAYDTVTIDPYSFPNQSRSAVYQCNDNSFSLSAAVTGGVGPFEYEIIGSTPSSPSIATPRQSTAVFNINNGTSYSLIRLRSIDACGNAALNDVSVLPLQNIVARANTTCLYNNITLTVVDTIPNASYKWYRKTTATDSVLMVEDVAYNIPFLEPEETGTYVCRVSVNNDCLVRLAYFDLTGDCNHVVLPGATQLKGKSTTEGHKLTWASYKNDIKEFIIERKTGNAEQFIAVGKVNARTNGSTYTFTETNPQNGTTIYRLKIVGNQSISYSNMVSLGWNMQNINVYPNPVKNEVNISMKNNTGGQYEVQLINASGQTINKDQWKPGVQGTYSYKRSAKDKPGMYVLKLINRLDNTSNIYKLLFE